MEAIKKMLKRAKTINIDELFFFIFSQPEVQEKIFELNTEGQLEFGKLADGGQLPNYSEFSQMAFGKADEPIKLQDTGAFWRSFGGLILNGKEFVYQADSLKDDNGVVVDIVTRYASFGEVMGLNDDSMNKLVDFIKPKTQDYIRQWLLR